MNLSISSFNSSSKRPLFLSKSFYALLTLLLCLSFLFGMQMAYAAGGDGGGDLKQTCEATIDFNDAENFNSEGTRIVKFTKAGGSDNGDFGSFWLDRKRIWLGAGKNSAGDPANPSHPAYSPGSTSLIYTPVINDFEWELNVLIVFQSTYGAWGNYLQSINKNAHIDVYIQDMHPEDNNLDYTTEGSTTDPEYWHYVGSADYSFSSGALRGEGYQINDGKLDCNYQGNYPRNPPPFF